MKKGISIILVAVLCLLLNGCADEARIKESVLASVSQSQAAEIEAELAILKQEKIDEMVGNFDCFKVGEPATIADIEFTVIEITSLGPQKKATGKMSDYTIKVEFSITNNSSNTYIPLADMRLIVDGDLIQSYDANPQSAERAEYDKGVPPGETKTFSNTFLYNLNDPDDNVVVARWAPYSSTVPQNTLVVFFDINPELETAMK